MLCVCFAGRLNHIGRFRWTMIIGRVSGMDDIRLWSLQLRRVKNER